MQNTINKLFADFSDITFKKDTVFMWSPQDKTIRYEAQGDDNERWMWSLLHEIGHATLEHKAYRDDLELLIMEVAAWKEAKNIAAKYSLKIDGDHIDDCINTYRDWLHSRSRCVECKAHALQADITTYQCHNCGTKWKVPASRMCDIRRRRVTT